MNKLTFLPVIIFLVSCKEISFHNPQPEGKKALASVPLTLQGKYLTMTETGQVSKDTVIITSNGYRFGYFDIADRSAENDEYERGVLGDSLILKYHKGFYFLNINEKPEWLLRVLKQEKNGDLIYMGMEDKRLEFKDYLKKLSHEIKLDSIRLKDETLYQIDPTPNQLIHLINKGFFSETRLKKIH
jgi:hypothetical protein